MERACGHTITKQDLLSEWLSHLEHRSQQLRQAAEAENLPPLKQAELLQQAQEREMRKAKLLKSASYRKSEKAQLVKWLGDTQGKAKP